MPTAGSMNKLDTKWRLGLWIGYIISSSEYLIGTDDGIDKARSFRPVSNPTVRWDIDRARRMKRTAWELNPGVNTTAIHPRVMLLKTDAVEPTDRPHQIRSFRLQRSDVEKHGSTPSCPGCTALRNQAPPVNHNDECMTRFTTILTEANDPRITNERQRMDRQIQLQQQDKAPPKQPVPTAAPQPVPTQPPQPTT